MQPVTDDGIVLNANFVLEQAARGFDLILRSRTGAKTGKAPRNADYGIALDLLLARLGKIDAQLLLSVVDSLPMRAKPLSDRQIVLPNHAYPIALAEIVDFQGLRHAIGRAQQAVGRKPDARGEGNRTRQIRLSVGLPRAWPLQDLEAFLAKGDIPITENLWTEAATDDPMLLASRVRAIRLKVSAALSGRLPTPPPGAVSVQRIDISTARFVRDPNVIAWVLLAAGNNCDVCSGPAPFMGYNDEPFLEVHHVKPIAEGGPDTVDNAIAACPNCHRELHYGIRREALRTLVITKLKRLKDYLSYDKI